MAEILHRNESLSVSDTASPILVAIGPGVPSGEPNIYHGEDMSVLHRQTGYIFVPVILILHGPKSTDAIGEPLMLIYSVSFTKITVTVLPLSY